MICQWSVEVWWGAELGVPDQWFWLSDHLRRSHAVAEQERLEYCCLRGGPARVVRRTEPK